MPGQLLATAQPTVRVANAQRAARAATDRAAQAARVSRTAGAVRASPPAPAVQAAPAAAAAPVSRASSARPWTVARRPRPIAPLPCRTDPELFFAEHPDKLRQAQALCQLCPDRQACLAGALERGEPCGVWGGELFLYGTIINEKRPRGRPRKAAAA